MKASQIYVQLVNMRNEGGSLLYARLRLAKKLLEDREWIADPEQGGGDYVTAWQRLEDTAFGDLCGAMTLSVMLGIFDTFPKESVWKEHKYNLRSLHRQYLKFHKPQATNTERPATKEDKLLGRIESVEQQLREARDEARRYRRIIVRLCKGLGVDPGTVLNPQHDQPEAEAA